MPKEPEETISAERGCSKMGWIRDKNLPKVLVSAENGPFCGTRVFLQKDRKDILMQKAFLQQVSVKKAPKTPFG